MQISSKEGFQSISSTSFSISALFSIRLQIDESNHHKVYMLTHLMAIVFSPLIKSTNNGYQVLATQMSRIADVFGISPELIMNQVENTISLKQPRVEPLQLDNLNLENVMMVNQNQNADNVLD